MSDFQSHCVDQDELTLIYKDLYRVDSICMPFPWTQEQWRVLDLSSSHYYLCVIYNSGAELVGFSLWSTANRDCAHLLKISVLPQEQSYGLGSFLLKKDLTSLAELNFSNFYLEVAVNNQAAIKIYEKFNFDRACLKKKFYSDGTGAYAMQLKLE